MARQKNMGCCLGIVFLPHTFFLIRPTVMSRYRHESLPSRAASSAVFLLPTTLAKRPPPPTPSSPPPQPRPPHWFPLVLSGSLWFPLVLWASLWLCVVLFGSLWLFLVPSGSLWFSLVPSVSLWFSLVRSTNNYRRHCGTRSGSLWEILARTVRLLIVWNTSLAVPSPVWWRSLWLMDAMSGLRVYIF